MADRGCTRGGTRRADRTSVSSVVRRRVNLWPKACLDDLHEWFRRQHRHHAGQRHRAPLIAPKAPVELPPVPQKNRGLAPVDHDPVRQSGDFSGVGDLAAPLNPRGMQRLVDGLRQGSPCIRLPPDLPPDCGELVVTLAPTFRAGAMPGGQRRGLIKEKELRIAPPAP